MPLYSHVLEGAFSKGGQGWPELETKVAGREDKRPSWRQVSRAVEMGPCCVLSGCSSCLLSSPDGHSRSFPGDSDLARDPRFTEFSNWRKHTEGDRV